MKSLIGVSTGAMPPQNRLEMDRPIEQGIEQCTQEGAVVVERLLQAYLAWNTSIRSLS